MADYAALQEQNKLAALRAMAAGNPDPYQGSSDVISGAQDEALQRFAGDAAGRSAPQGSISQGEAMIRGPGDAALAGIGQSSDAYTAELAALKAEAENPAVPPSAYGSSSTKEGPGYNQYGGYKTSAEYENAVLGRAVQMETQRAAEVEGQRVAEENANTEANIGAVKAVQAKNEAVVGGPGAVIHGIGYNAPPAPPRTVTAPAITPGRYASPRPALGEPSMGAGRFGGGGPPLPPPSMGRDRFGGAPPAPPYVGPPTAPAGADTSNYSPEAVAMMRAAGDQGFERYRQGGAWHGATDIEAAYAPQEEAIADPRNMYEFAQRAAINELGGDPYEAIGRFSPDWAMKTYALPETQGPLDYQAAQNEAGERAANEAAGLGAYTDAQIQSREDNIIRNTPDYATGAEIVRTQQESLAGGPSTDQPVTLDGLRIALAQHGVSADAAMQIIKDYGRLYAGQSYFNLPEETQRAAATAGTQ